SAVKNSSRKTSASASLMPTSSRQTLPAKLMRVLSSPDPSSQPSDRRGNVLPESMAARQRNGLSRRPGSTRGLALMTSASTSPPAGRYPAGARAFPHASLLGIGHLETHEILYLLDEAEQWVALNRQPNKHTDRLAGLTIINAFFENSTRTLLS